MIANMGLIVTVYSDGSPVTRAISVIDLNGISPNACTIVYVSQYAMVAIIRPATILIVTNVWVIVIIQGKGGVGTYIAGIIYSRDLPLCIEIAGI